MKKVQVLMSTMNIQNKKEFEKQIVDCNIKNDVIIVNQTKNKIEKIEIENKKMYSYQEKGASNSRNRLLELADEDICVFADNDTKFVNDYENIIWQAYEKNPEADGILFYVENINKTREKNKKIGNKKINKLDIMKARIYELTLKKETINKIKEKGIKFDTNIGPGTKILKGEETIFLAELLNNNFKLYSVNQKLGTVGDCNSSWFTGYNKKYLQDQGVIFYKIFPKYYKLIILQYIIRKHNLYKNNLNIFKAYKEMLNGIEEYKTKYERDNKEKNKETRL